MSNQMNHLTIAPGIQVMSRRRHWSEPERSRNAKTRIFVDIKGESILTNLIDRTSRPVHAWGKLVRNEVLPALGMADLKVRWSRHAGCAMCPCSPGFIADGHLVAAEGEDVDTTDAKLVLGSRWGARDVWVSIDLDVTGIPAYIPSPERDHRAAQIGVSA